MERGGLPGKSILSHYLALLHSDRPCIVPPSKRFLSLCISRSLVSVFLSRRCVGLVDRVIAAGRTRERGRRPDDDDEQERRRIDPSGLGRLAFLLARSPAYLSIYHLSLLPCLALLCLLCGRDQHGGRWTVEARGNGCKSICSMYE